MKPSERRALEAEKRKRAEEMSGHEAEQEHTTQAPDIDREPCSSQQTANKPYRRKEGFIQSHIRLITFIITTALLLTVLGPLGIDWLVSSKRDKVITNKIDMSIDTVYAIHDSADKITWSSFRNFNYTDYSHDNGKYIIREYPITNSRLVLKVGGSSSGSRPDYAQLIDYKSGDYIDVLKKNPHEFIKSIEQEEKE